MSAHAYIAISFALCSHPRTPQRCTDSDLDYLDYLTYRAMQHWGGISALALCGHSGDLLTASRDCRIKRWATLPPEVAAQRAARPIRRRSSAVDDAAALDAGALSPRTASTEEHAVIVDAAGAQQRTGAVGAHDAPAKPQQPACVHTYSGHTSWVTALAASPLMLVSASYDTTIRFWDAAARSDRPQHTFTASHADYIMCLALAPHAARFFSAGLQGQLNFWDLERCARTLLRCRALFCIFDCCTTVSVCGGPQPHQTYLQVQTRRYRVLLTVCIASQLAKRLCVLQHMRDAPVHAAGA